MSEIAAWLAAYASKLGRELPPRASIAGYDKGPAWALLGDAHGPTLADAEELARRGLCVFPLRPGAKAPATRHGFQDASREPGMLSQWWPEGRRGCNIGIATGARSNVVLVDLDGETGISSFAHYVALGLPTTWCALTAGGLHFYFAHPGVELPNTAGKLGKNIDTRGDGGYAVAPPSVLECGLSYRWLCAPWELEAPARLPPSMLSAWRPARSSPPPRFAERRAFRPGEDGEAFALRMLDSWARKVATAPKGLRDALIAKFAYAAGARVCEGRLTRSAAERALLEAVAAWGPVSPRDRTKVERGITAGITGKR